MLIVGLWLWWTGEIEWSRSLYFSVTLSNSLSCRYVCCAVIFYLLAAILSRLKVHSFFPNDYQAISVDGSVLLDEEDVSVDNAIGEVEKYALYPGNELRS
jgi:hypothetical protein